MVKHKKVLVLGITGMVGNAIFRYLSSKHDVITFGTSRSASIHHFFPEVNKEQIITSVDVLNIDNLSPILSRVKPDVVINCTGLIKQLSSSNDPLSVLPINSIFPHQLSNICREMGIRLIQFGTDCSFSGEKGMYKESDISDAKDLYGKSKYIGEIHNEKHAITIRTSTIGHELESKNGLVEWFLIQKGSVKGFRKAIFSGLPTVELARVIADYVLPHSDLHGLYHVSAQPINKFDLLSLVAHEYKKDIEIIPEDMPEIDRSLDSTFFTEKTGYLAPEWPELISIMHSHQPR